MRTRLLALLFVLCAAPALAQDLPKIPANASFLVSADHDGQNVDAFCAIIDDTRETCGVGADKVLNGVVSILVPGLTKGLHTARVSAFNADNPRVLSAPVTFQVVAPPPAVPTNIKVKISATAEITLPDGQTASVPVVLDLGALILK